MKQKKGLGLVFHQSSECVAVYYYYHRHYHEPCCSLANEDTAAGNATAPCSYAQYNVDAIKSHKYRYT